MICKFFASSPITFLFRYIKPLQFLLFIPGVQSKSFRDRVRVFLDYYYPDYLNEHSYYEVYDWYEKLGYVDIKPLKQPISYSGIKKKLNKNND